MFAVAADSLHMYHILCSDMHVSFQWSDSLIKVSEKNGGCHYYHPYRQLPNRNRCYLQYCGAEKATTLSNRRYCVNDVYVNVIPSICVCRANNVTIAGVYFKVMIIINFLQYKSATSHVLEMRQMAPSSNERKNENLQRLIKTLTPSIAQKIGMSPDKSSLGSRIVNGPTKYVLSISLPKSGKLTEPKLHRFHFWGWILNS